MNRHSQAGPSSRANREAAAALARSPSLFGSTSTIQPDHYYFVIRSRGVERDDGGGGIVEPNFTGRPCVNPQSYIAAPKMTSCRAVSSRPSCRTVHEVFNIYSRLGVWNESFRDDQLIPRTRPCPCQSSTRTCGMTHAGPHGWSHSAYNVLRGTTLQPPGGVYNLRGRGIADRVGHISQKALRAAPQYHRVNRCRASSTRLEPASTNSGRINHPVDGSDTLEFCIRCDSLCNLSKSFSTVNLRPFLALALLFIPSCIGIGRGE